MAVPAVPVMLPLLQKPQRLPQHRLQILALRQQRLDLVLGLGLRLGMGWDGTGMG